ncbi:MAG: hypothetical protein AB1847_11515 [bacterium]
MSREVRFIPSPVSPKRKTTVLRFAFLNSILSFLLMTGVLTPLSAFGEPIISDISFSSMSRGETAYAGSEEATALQSGEIGDLRGEGLLDQVTNHWIHWPESQGSFEDTNGWVRNGNCWLRDNWECWAQTAERRDMDVIFDPSVAVIGHQSYRNHLYYTQDDWNHPKEEPGKGIFCPLTWWDAPDSNQYFYRYYVRYSGPVFKWTNNSFKQFYVHNLFNMTACMWDDIPEGKGPSMYDIQGGDRLFVHFGKRMELDQWYCIELMVKKAGGGIELKFWLDGKPCDIYDGNGDLLTSPWMNSYRESDGSLRFGPLELGTVNCQNWTHDQLPVDQYIWFDGFAMSPYQRIYPGTIVEMGDSPDYESAQRITQKLVWMEDQEVRFRTDLSGLGDGPYYLWITNNQGERSRAYRIGGDHGTMQALSGPEIAPAELESATLTGTAQSRSSATSLEFSEQPVCPTSLLCSKRFNAFIYNYQ